MPESLALIIEDDHDIARLFEVTLQQAGFKTEICYNGDCAWDRINELFEQSLRLIVLDLNLPRVNGVDILRRLRASEQLKNLPVLVATANPQMADEVYDLAEIVLIKPVSYEQFRDLVNRFK